MMDIEYGSTTDIVDSGSQCANFKVRKKFYVGLNL